MLRLGFTLIALLACLSGRARAAVEELTAAGAAEFTAAYQAWDGPRFAAAAELFRRAAADSPSNATNFHWQGAARFHQMLHLQHAQANPTNEAAAKVALNQAVETLEAAVKLDDHQAVSHALLATLYGMKINGSLIRAARYGPRLSKHRDLALKHGSANPRVQYLLGMCLFHTSTKPAEWRAALETLRKAEELFSAEAGTPAGPLEPRWGYDSCLTFIGRSHELLGERKESAEYFRKALAMHPADNLAKEGLKRVLDVK